jgi:hypothetical protein
MFSDRNRFYFVSAQTSLDVCKVCIESLPFGLGQKGEEQQQSFVKQVY